MCVKVSHTVGLCRQDCHASDGNRQYRRVLKVALLKVRRARLLAAPSTTVRQRGEGEQVSGETDGCSRPSGSVTEAKVSCQT